MNPTYKGQDVTNDDGVYITPMWARESVRGSPSNLAHFLYFEISESLDQMLLKTERARCGVTPYMEYGMQIVEIGNITLRRLIT